jgi:predicted amidohydrolase YtcJ
MNQRRINMKKSIFSGKLSRRQFLEAGGVGLMGLTLSCNSGKSVAQKPSGSVPTLADPGQAANTILTNGKILTIQQSNPQVQALAIKDGLIQAVGSDDDILQLTGNNTQVFDLQGKTVTPGLIDPHVHFRIIGLDYLYYIPFLPPDVKDTQTLQNAIAQAASEKAPGDWIQGYYLILTDNMFPDRYVLDAAAPDHPVWIMHIGGHWGSANSAALKAAGVTSGTQSPQGGIIEKDESGEPTGLFYNHRAMDVLRRVAPPITYDTIVQAILNTQPVMASCGVTSYQDNNVRDLEHIRAYQQLAKDGKLYLRSTLYLTLEWPGDLDKVDQVEDYHDDFSRFAGFKFLIDGQMPTAYCHQPHNGTSWDMPTWNPDEFKSVIRSLHDTGLQISTHCFGDAAADLTLDAYEAAMNANPRSDPRHRLEHLVLTTPQATTRMRDLGVIASANPHFIYVAGDSYENNFGSERMDRIIVTREWLDAGVHLTIGSDAPSVPFHHPQATMAGGISRLTFNKNVVGKDQCLTFDEALRAHTIEAAYAAHEENVKGSLETGKLADLVVWNEDPTDLGFAKLAATTGVNLTMVGGKIVYQA